MFTEKFNKVFEKFDKFDMFVIGLCTGIITIAAFVYLG